MANFGLDQVIAEAERLSSQAAEQTAQVAQLSRGRAEDMRSVADAIAEAGSLTVDITEKAELAKLKARKQTTANATALGTNPEAATSVIADINTRIREDLIRFNQASTQLEQIDSQDNLLANPLGWFNSLMNRDEYAAQAEHSAKRIDANTAALSRMYKLTQEDALNNLTLAETSDAESIAKQSRQIALKAQVDATKARIDAATYDIEGLEFLRRASNEEFDRRVRVYNARRQEYEFETSRQMQQQQLGLQKRALDRQVGEDKAFEFIGEMVNLGAKAVSLNSIPLNVIRAQYGKNTPLGQQLAMLESIGTRSYQKGSLDLGSSPFEVKQALGATGGKLPDSISRDVREAFNYADAEFANLTTEIAKLGPGYAGNEKTKGLDAKDLEDPATVARVYNELVSEALTKIDSQLDKAIPVRLNLLAEKYPQIKNTQLYEKVLEPLSIGVGSSPIAIPDLGKIVTEHVAKRDLSPEVASKELAEFSALVFNDYRASSGRMLIGARLPETEQFKVDLTISGAEGILQREPGSFFNAFGSLIPKEKQVTINPTNPADWNSYFQRILHLQKVFGAREAIKNSFNTGTEEQ